MKRLQESTGAKLGKYLVWFKQTELPCTHGPAPAVVIEVVFDSEAQRERFINKHLQAVGFMGEGNQG